MGGMKDLPKQTNLVKRGAVFYFRCRIPADLVEHYQGRREIKRSLRTSDYKKALELVHVESLKQDQEFTEVRRCLNPKMRDYLDDAEIKRLTALMIHSSLSADEEMRWEGLDEFMFNKMAQWHTEGRKELRAALARGNTTVIEEQVDDWLCGQGIELAKDSESYRNLCFSFLKAAVEVTEKQSLRHQGEVVETPPAPAFLPSSVVSLADESGNNPRLSVLFERWVTVGEEERIKSTVTEFRTSIRRFIEVNGDIPVQAITKTHAREFRDAMLRLPSHVPSEWRSLTVPQIIEKAEHAGGMPRLSARTINDKMLGALNAVLNWAVNEGYCEYNPVQGIKAAVKKVNGDRRLPFTITDLNHIFHFPIFTKGERPQAGGGEAAKWLPLLALFTGARLEELGQLLTADVKQEESIHYLDMLTISDGQRRKTESSRRLVPIHPELVRLGFLNYVNQRVKAGDRRLFPNLRENSEKLTRLWSKWWGRYMRKHGINDPHKVFHSFRHTVKDGFRNAGVNREVYDRIQGHKGGGVSWDYGVGHELKILAKEMMKLEYPGLDLEHIVSK